MTTADLLIYQGDDYSGVVTVTDSDGQPVDITGYTAKAQIRRAAADLDAEVVTEITCSVASPAVTFAIPHDETATLAGSYVWDLQITSPDDIITTIIGGRVRVTQEVTRG